MSGVPVRRCALLCCALVATMCDVGGAEISYGSEPEEYEEYDEDDGVDDFADLDDFSGDDTDVCIDFARRGKQPYLFPNYTKAHVLHFGVGEGFSVKERLHLVVVGEAVARAKGGWLTDRHANYPTTDLSVRDNLPKYYAKRIMALVTRWILPRLAELGSLRAADLSIDDLFIVKYEYNLDGSTQKHLEPHIDGSAWTFSMGLNDPSEYVGGGTHFMGSGIGTFHSNLTTILAHSGALRHEGLRITSGKRYILVGFVGHTNDCY